MMMKKYNVKEVERRTGYRLPKTCSHYKYPFPWMSSTSKDKEGRNGRNNGIALVLGIIALGVAMIAGDDVIDFVSQSLT